MTDTSRTERTNVLQTFFPFSKTTKHLETVSARVFAPVAGMSRLPPVIGVPERHSCVVYVYQADGTHFRQTFQLTLMVSEVVQCRCPFLAPRGSGSMQRTAEEIPGQNAQDMTCVLVYLGRTGDGCSSVTFGSKRVVDPRSLGERPTVVVVANPTNVHPSSFILDPSPCSTNEYGNLAILYGRNQSTAVFSEACLD